jgi:hypothetical protein
MIKEDTDYGFDQTHHTRNGHRGDGAGRSAAICSSAASVSRCSRAVSMSSQDGK